MKSKTVAASSDLSTLEQSPALVDQITRTAMHTLGEENEQRTSALQLERQRRSAKYGPDSPQVKESASRLELHEQIKLGLKIHTERLDLQTPDTSSDSFIVYGRVLNNEGDGLAGLNVAALDESGKIVAGTDTDDRGSFELRISDSTYARKGSSGKIEVEGAAAGSDEEPYLRLQVSDRRKKILYRDQDAFQAAPGQLSYREIVLSQPPDTSKGTKTKRAA